MKCSLFRDLLPLYLEGDCSETTNQVLDEHMQNCSECYELYELMKTPIDVKVIDQSVITKSEEKNSQFWKIYYGRLIMKGLGLFFIVYTMIVVFLVLLK